MKKTEVTIDTLRKNGNRYDVVVVKDDAAVVIHLEKGGMVFPITDPPIVTYNSKQAAKFVQATVRIGLNASERFVVNVGLARKAKWQTIKEYSYKNWFLAVGFMVGAFDDALPDTNFESQLECNVGKACDAMMNYWDMG